MCGMGGKAVPGHMVMDETTCENCGVCSEDCPFNAIDLDTHLIDANVCTRCLNCVMRCPTGSIEFNEDK